MKQHTAMRIAQVIYNAACRRFEAVVEFFTPGLAQPLRVAVRVSAGQDLGHRQLVLALRREAVRHRAALGQAGRVGRGRRGFP